MKLSPAEVPVVHKYSPEEPVRVSYFQPRAGENYYFIFIMIESENVGTIQSPDAEAPYLTAFTKKRHLE